MTTWQTSTMLSATAHWRQNERRFISTYRGGNNDRTRNHCGGLVMMGYNTGRVVIGCRYEPPTRSHMNAMIYGGRQYY